MGYTIYFEQNRPFTTSEWDAICAATRNMFHRLKQIKGGNGHGRPIVDNIEIIFNGDGAKGEDHETFQLSKHQFGSYYFCKTNRKPYDCYVKAVLVLANYYAPGALNVSCDGDNEPDCWTEGVRLANLYVPLTGRMPCSPIEMKRFNEQMEKVNAEMSAPKVSNSKELENTIQRLEDLARLVDHKPMLFLANYLKANIDDIKDAY